jgi:peptide/nickel transport system permease protein
MISYITRRLLSGLVALFLFTSFLFFAIELWLPGDYASQFFGLSPAETAELRQMLGLDLPLWQRYLHWLQNLLTLNLRSYSISGLGAPVAEIIGRVLPPTLLVFGLGTWIAFALGLWLGKLTAWRTPRIFKGAATASAVALYTAFPPWLSFLMVYAFAERLGLPPTIPTIDFRQRASPMGASDVISYMLLGLAAVIALLIALNAIADRLIRRRMPSPVFILLLLGGWAASLQLLGVFEPSLAIARGALLPIATFALLSFGDIMLIMRISMADTAFEDYVFAARAKGITEKRVRDRHAARTAMLPVMARMISTIPYLLAGLVMIETSLKISGLGTTLLFAVGFQDLSTALGGIFIIGLISLICRLALEVAQAALDPRLRRPAASRVAA